MVFYALTFARYFLRGFQHLPEDLANVDALKKQRLTVLNILLQFSWTLTELYFMGVRNV